MQVWQGVVGHVKSGGVIGQVVGWSAWLVVKGAVYWRGIGGLRLWLHGAAGLLCVHGSDWVKRGGRA